MIAVACVFTLCIAVPQARAASSIPYGGDQVLFVEADLSSPLGMFSNPSGDMQVTRQGGNVHISFTPKNQTVFVGFYLDASIDDEGTWNYYIPATGEHGTYAYDFTIPESYCGAAWPIAPLKLEAGGSSGTRTTSGQYYMAVPPAESIPSLDNHTVTFTDGLGHIIDTSEVVAGSDATPPADPVREGYVFDGWDADFTNVTEDRVVNAKWRIEGGVGYYVTFTDGFGGVIGVPQLVREGDSAVAPADPEREGFTFTGWKPAFSDVRSDLTVEAQWLDNDQLSIEAVRTAIAALPDNPKDVLRDTGNETVANAAAAYNALASELQAQIPDDERLKLAQCAIAVLPSDPFKVADEHRGAIEAASLVAASLPEALMAELDSYDGDKAISSSRSYGRYLENAVWALDSLRSVNNVTTLKNGTYTGQVQSASSMGKSNSRRAIAFTVKSVKVTGGKMTAVLEHGSNSSQSLKFGGVEYQNLQEDPSKNSYFEVPLCLNSTFHFSVKGKNATDDTDAITYELAVSADEAALAPDAAKGESGSSSGSGSAKGGAAAASGNGTNLNTLVKNSTGSSDAASKSAESASKDSASKDSAKRKDSAGKTVAEVEVPDTEVALAAGGSGDLGPAIAGFALLFVSLGALGFTLRFLRRESAPV